jgi:hypothetical protein
LDNALESACICASDDPRRTSKLPGLFEVTVLRPKPWRPVRTDNLRRERRRAIAVVTNAGRQAIYLNSVWDEEKAWSAQELVRHLLVKAGAKPQVTLSSSSSSSSSSSVERDDYSVYEIDCCTILEGGNLVDSGFFSSSPPSLARGSTSFSSSSSSFSEPYLRRRRPDPPSDEHKVRLRMGPGTKIETRPKRASGPDSNRTARALQPTRAHGTQRTRSNCAATCVPM